MSHTILRPFIVKVSILGYFPLLVVTYIISKFHMRIRILMVNNRISEDKV